MIDFENNIYDGYSEDDEVKEIKGITDAVTDYTYTDIAFPCIIFKSGLRLEKHKVKVISNMVKSATGSVVKDITLYFAKGKDLYKMGMISGVQVGSLIEMVNLGCIEAYYDKDTKLEGSLIYSLCSI